jgi:hypothetical protein
MRTLRYVIPSLGAAIASLVHSVRGDQGVAREWLIIAVLWLVVDGVQRERP